MGAWYIRLVWFERERGHIGSRSDREPPATSEGEKGKEKKHADTLPMLHNTHLVQRVAPPQQATISGVLTLRSQVAGSTTATTSLPRSRGMGEGGGWLAGWQETR